MRRAAQSCYFSIFVILFVAMFSILFVPVVYAGPPWEEVEKILEPNGQEFHQFGDAVALSGNLAVVGMIDDDEKGMDAGAAYVFDIDTGEMVYKLFGSDEVDRDLFGMSVGIDGRLAVVGSLFSDGRFFNSGSAYVFDMKTGSQLFKLFAPDGAENDNFGNSVAISGNLVVVGAPADDDHGDSSGSAYVFDLATGQSIFKLVASDAAAGDGFGGAVAIDGNLAVIGSIFSDGMMEDSGAVYVFDMTTGDQIQKLVASDGSTNDFFGISVSIRGDRVVAGAEFDGDLGSDSGSAYVFDALTGEQLFKLHASDGSDTDFFGQSVSLSGHHALIGAGGADGGVVGSGAAYVFDITTGEEESKIFSDDGSLFDHFGSSVALAGGTAVIGALGDDDNGDGSGSVYVFEPRMTNLLTVEPEPLVSGENGIFTLIRANPNEMSWLLYSVDGLGSTFIKPLNVTVDLTNPKIAFGPGLTDHHGNLRVVGLIPDVVSPLHIWFQAVQDGNVTNYVATEIVP